MDISMNVGAFSKYRTELMGFSAIAILICHTTGNGIVMPQLLSYLLAQGQIGVDIFLFLSGMGLWYSLSKFYETNTVIDCEIKSQIPLDKYIWLKTLGCCRKLNVWYAKRYIRILVPYVIIQGSMTAVKCIFDGESFWHWASVVSTIEFWISHRAAWFIALLLPLYLITPWLFELLKKNGVKTLVLITVVCYLISLYPNNAESWTFFKNLQFAIIRVPAFVVGMYMAPKIKKNNSISWLTISLMLLGAIVMLMLTKKPVNSYFFLITPLMLLICRSFTICENSLYNKVCKFYGGISLESYLLNTNIPFVVLFFMCFLNIPDYNNLLMYSFVVIIGTLLSVLVNRISKLIIYKFNHFFANN